MELTLDFPLSKKTCFQNKPELNIEKEQFLATTVFLTEEGKRALLGQEEKNGKLSLKYQNLNQKNLAEVFEFIVRFFPQIETLDLSQNKISRLPINFNLSRLPCLNRLILSNNLLIDLPNLQSLNLRFLNVSGNLLLDLPVWLGNLYGFYGMKNRFTTFPRCLLQIPTLYEINLSFNQIMAVPMDLTSRLPRLSSLKVHHNPLQTFPNSKRAIRMIKKDDKRTTRFKGKSKPLRDVKSLLLRKKETEGFLKKLDPLITK